MARRLAITHYRPMPQSLWCGVLQMLEIDDDVESCTLCRLCDPLDQFLRAGMIQGSLEIYEQRRALIMPFRLNAQPARLGRGGLLVLFLFWHVQRIRNQVCGL